jgi:hypothetical protein
MVEKLYGVGPGQIWVLAAEHSCANGGEIFGDDYCRSFGGLRGGIVFGIGDEGELAGGGMLDSGYSGDFGVGRGIVEAGVQGFGYVG